jgi:hypothetical protein
MAKFQKLFSAGLIIFKRLASRVQQLAPSVILQRCKNWRQRARYVKINVELAGAFLRRCADVRAVNGERAAGLGEHS